MRTGNLSRAAEQLNLSQSALSSQLKQLEEELGLQLFRRTARGMELSEAGRELLPAIDDLLGSAEKLTHKAKSLRQGTGETLNIGLNTDPGFLRVGDINRRLKQLDEHLNVIFLASQTTRTPQLLRQGQLDLAFVYGHPSEPDIRSQQLTAVRLCIVIPTTVTPAGTELGWQEIADLPWIWVEYNSPPYAAILHEFESRQLIPKQVVKTVDEFIVKQLVADGQGVAVMREDEARPLVENGTHAFWSKGWLSLPLSLAWLARNEERQRIQAARAAIGYLWHNPSWQNEALERFNY